MKFEARYFKQCDDWLYAHIYEHIISNAFTKYLTDSDYLENVDYDVHFKTIDELVYFIYYSQRINISKLFINFVKQYRPTQKDLEAAVVQVSLEYSREIKFVDYKQLHVKMTELHEVKWNSFEDDVISSPIKKAKQSYKRKEIHYGSEGSCRFVKFESVYDIPKCEYELQTLAVYVLQAIGLNIVNALYDKYDNIYDIGDNWAEYQNYSGYINNLVVESKSDITEKDIAQTQKKVISQLAKPDSVKRMTEFIRLDYSSSCRYFSTNDFYKNSYQLIGKKRFLKLATVENVSKLLQMIETDVVKVE